MWGLGFIISLACVTATLNGTLKEELQPYLLPDDHPSKPALDALFSSSRVLKNLDSLVKAGFRESHPRKFSHLIVTTHPSFPGYVFKIYLDSQRFHSMKPEYELWKLRIQGANWIRQEIVNRNLSSQMKVPQKWIYLLPEDPEPNGSYYPKYTVLFEEDMNLVSSEENYNLWASDQITPEFLSSVYHLLDDLGLIDCAKPDNIPFSQDGRIAFIDTQSYGFKHVRFKKLTKYLSERNQEIWKSLINE